MMISSAQKYQVSDIFAFDKSIKYQIPKFQREYVWGRDQWEMLFNDIYESDGEHFLGSIICINKTQDALKVIPMEVIDGQQRLTTISLFYAAIYSVLIKKDNSDHVYITETTNLKHRLIFKNEKDKLRLELQSQNNNHEDYIAIHCCPK